MGSASASLPEQTEGRILALCVEWSIVRARMRFVLFPFRFLSLKEKGYYELYIREGGWKES